MSYHAQALQLKEHLEELLNIDESHRRNGIKLLQMICNNVLNDPINPKFRDLNFAKIGKRLEHCQPALLVLFDVGFTLSADGDRLHLDPHDLNMAKMWCVKKALAPYSADQPGHLQGHGGDIKEVVGKLKESHTADDNKSAHREQVNAHSVQILNRDDEQSTMSPNELLLYDFDPNPARFIVSDADEELIILIKFKKFVDLKSFKIYALSLDDDSNIDDASPPKQIHIFKLSHLNQDFEDIKGLKPHKSLICSIKKLSKGHNVNLRKNISKPLAFAKVKFMAIFIESNQDDTDKTYLHGLSLKAECNGTKQSPSRVTSLTNQQDAPISSMENINGICYCSTRLAQLSQSVSVADHCICHLCFQMTAGRVYLCPQGARRGECCYYHLTDRLYLICSECASTPNSIAYQLGTSANERTLVMTKKAEGALTTMR